MTGLDDHKQLIAISAKARALAEAKTDPIALDILEKCAAECEERASLLQADANRRRLQAP